MAGFIQIIEFTTSRIDEVREFGEKYRADRQASGESLVVRGTVAVDRDRPNTYLNIVEFESYEAAMENSNNPTTSEFSKKMMELCDGPPKFLNLDVVDIYDSKA